MAVKGRGRGRGRVGGGRPGGRGRGRGASASSFLAPHSGPQASAIANSQAGAEFNPEIHDLRGQAKGSRKREQDLGSWYAQLAADYKAAQGKGAAALQSVEDTTTRQLAEADSRSSAEQSSLAGGDAAFAKLVGGPTDSAGLAKIAEAASAASRGRVDQARLPISEQANFTARLGSDSAAARLQGIEDRRSEQQRRDKIRSDLTSARKDKGRARVGKKEEIRQADRSYALDRSQQALARQEARAAEQQAAADAALAQIEAQRSARQDAIGNRQEQERIGISRKNAATSRRSQRASARAAKEENKGGLSTAEKRARGEHNSDAMSTAKALLGIKIPKSDTDWSKFEAALIEKLGSSYGAEAARAVAQLRAAQKQKAEARSRKLHQGRVPGH